MPVIIGAEDVEKQGKTLSQQLNDIYIAVFFDGTSNNMVRQMYVSEDNKERCALEKEKKELRSKIGRLKSQSEVSDDKVNKEVKEAEARIAEIDQILKEQESNKEYDKVQELRKERRELILYKHSIAHNAPYYGDIAQELYVTNNKIAKIENELEKINAYNKITTKQLSQARTKGYSNVAILYSLFNENKTLESNSNIAVHHLYIEGSGSTNISSDLPMNINGLGFGLGLTGVTALVCRAVYYVTNYLNSQGANISQDTNLHFYIFGFSRGATCARVFANLITRGKDKRIARESEFTEFLPKDYFVNDRLAFLEAGAGKNSFDIKEEKITVDYLGIYDTVASIGFLKQKDGWNDPLRFPYALAKNYKDNWHYLNASEYGLFSPQNGRVLHTLHLGALDEFRENFAFTNLGSTLKPRCLEIMIPGCHSDVGGGYVDCLEQEIILHMKTKKNGKSINTYISKLSPHKRPIEAIMYSTESLLDKDTINDSMKRMELSLKAFYELSWLDENWDKDNAEKIIVNGNEVPCTARAVENDRLMFHHIKFRRNVKRGYSDIPLAMMLKYYECCGCLPLFESIPDEYNYTKNSDLQVLGDNMMKHVMSPPVPGGRRIWLYPGGNYYSDAYRKLRKKYLHFTSIGTSFHFSSAGSVIHFNLTMPFINQTGPIQIGLGNFGNTPNFDLNGVLCRITYDGDEVKPDSHESGVKYLYELPTDDCDVKNVEGNIEL